MTEPDTATAITAHADPAGEPPWALTLVVQVPKHDPPTLAAMCAATAAATVSLLAHPWALPGGPWATAVQRWQEGRIRKICRRARGARWDDVTEFDGVSVERGGACVRALVPNPVDETPPVIRKLQMTGFEPVDDTREVPLRTAFNDPSLSRQLVVAANPEVAMSGMKLAVQVAHAAQVFYLGLDPASRDAWRAKGFNVSMVRPPTADYVEHVPAADVVIVDAGFTEVAAGAQTVAAWWIS